MTEQYKLVPVEILDRFPEINPSNYGPDDVDALNAWGIELVLAAAPYRAFNNVVAYRIISTVHGKPLTDWIDGAPSGECAFPNGMYQLASERPIEPLNREAIRNAVVKDVVSTIRAKMDKIELDFVPIDAVYGLLNSYYPMKFQTAQLSGNAGELPSDKDLLKFGGNEQFFLFCSEDEFLDIAKSVLRRFMEKP